jgi:hypothetical protein
MFDDVGRKFAGEHQDRLVRQPPPNAVLTSESSVERPIASRKVMGSLAKLRDLAWRLGQKSFGCVDETQPEQQRDGQPRRDRCQPSLRRVGDLGDDFGPVTRAAC